MFRDIANDNSTFHHLNVPKFICCIFFNFQTFVIRNATMNIYINLVLFASLSISLGKRTFLILANVVEAMTKFI